MPRDLSGIDCIGYVRVSTERQAGETQTSLADQEAAVLAQAARAGRTVGAWFRDAGASGGTAEGRPAFSELVASCDAHQRPARSLGLVLALNSSRWGRFDEPEESAYWRVLLQKSGWIVRFSEGDDSENATLRTVMRAIGASQASEYRQAVKANARRGARGTAEQGFWGREAPFGYRRAVVFPPGRERALERGELKAPNEKVSLIPEETFEAPTVRRIFEAFAGGEHSLGSLARWLVGEVPSRVWSRRTVQAILKNPAYLGDVVGGQRSGEAAAGRGYGKRDAHPALIPRELFERVRERLGENRRRTRGWKGPYILSGLVTCTHCGEPYVGGGIGGHVRVKPETPDGRLWFYKCSSVANEPPYRKHCPGPAGTISRHLLDGAVITTIARELARPSMAARLTTELDRALGTAGETVVARSEQVRRAIDTLERKRERIVALVADATITQAEAASQLGAVRGELVRLHVEQEQLRFAARRSSIDPATREAMLQLAIDFPRVARESTGPALRALIRPWLAFATFDKSTRALTLGIRRIPATASSFPPNSQPGRG